MKKSEAFMKYIRCILVEKKYSLYQAKKYFGKDYIEFYSVYLQYVDIIKGLYKKTTMTASYMTRIGNLIKKLTYDLAMYDSNLNKINEELKENEREIEEQDKIWSKEFPTESNTLIDKEFYVLGDDGLYHLNIVKYQSLYNDYSARRDNLILEKERLQQGKALYETAISRGPARTAELEEELTEQLFYINFVLGG